MTNADSKDGVDDETMMLLRLTLLTLLTLLTQPTLIAITTPSPLHYLSTPRSSFILLTKQPALETPECALGY